MEKKYILTFDQGTSSSRAILFDKKANIVDRSQLTYSQSYPQKNWVEQDPIEIYTSQIKAAQNLIKSSKINTETIAGLGITNQRETTIIWDRETGIPIYQAIAWQDKRTENQCIKLRTTKETFIRKKTGLVADTYFSATKIQWILNNVKGARERAEKGELAFGTVDSWLIWNLTKGKTHITDYSNASRTMLFNIKTLEWDDDLLDLFKIPKQLLPEVVESSGELAVVDKSILGEEIPIVSILGDQQAALFGQTCFKKGMLKSTFGTGSFMLMNTGKKPRFSKNGLLTTIAWRINGTTHYALEGNMFIAGAVIKWLRDNLQIINSADESEYLASSVKDSGGITFVPALAGLGAPYWNNNVQGAILGLSLDTKKEHIVRASLESIAHHTYEMLVLMEKESDIGIKNFTVDGGASINNFLMQFVSDICRTEIIRPKVLDVTSLGVAYMAGLHLNFWTKDEISIIHKTNRRFKPKMNETEAQKQYEKWKQLVDLLIVGYNKIVNN